MKKIGVFGLSVMLIISCSSPVNFNSLNQTYSCEPSVKVKEETLRLINQVRSEGRYCGSIYYAATGRVQWNEQLSVAAKVHSDDMAWHNFFSHTGSDGEDVEVRAIRTGYHWYTIAENIHAGGDTTAKAIADLVKSPDHCKNIMNPAFQEVAAACSRRSATMYVTYYSQVLARQR